MHAKPKISRPIRTQIELMSRDLDSLVAADHPVRAVWEFVSALDLTKLYAAVASVEGAAGRPASDPAVLLALWIYATTQAVGSARALDRLCREHDAYRWLRGGVPVDYHLLSDFRSGNAEVLEELLVSTVATLHASGLVPFEELAQDGMRVRASAGAGSFRTEVGLTDDLAAAEERVRRLKAEVHAEAPSNKRQAAAQARAARERAERVRQALERLPELAARRKKGSGGGGAPAGGAEGTNDPGSAPPTASSTAAVPPEPASAATPVPVADPVAPTGVSPRAARLDTSSVRASTTDPECCVAKMGDGGFRPSYNVQLCTDSAHGIIVGVFVSDGSDSRQLIPMKEQVLAAYGTLPARWLADGGFTSLDNVEAFAAAGIELYAPPPKPRTTERGRYDPRPSDSEAVATWRQRMGTEAAREVYSRRGPTAELRNAQFRNQGLRQFGVRGRERAQAVALIHAITHNHQVIRRLTNAAI